MKKCRNCGKVILGKDESYICEPCLEKEVYRRENTCVWCGKEVTEETKSTDWCDPCCNECARKYVEGGVKSVYLAN